MLVWPNKTGNSESYGHQTWQSGVVIVYQVYEFTHTWSAEYFVSQSHIYCGFTGNVSTLTLIPFEPGCKDNLFLDQTVADVAKSWFHPPWLELDASFYEPDVMASSVSLGFLHSVPFVIILNHSLLLASNHTHYAASLGYNFCQYH